MPETIYRSVFDDTTVPQGAYEIIRSLDKNVRDISSELYVFRRENERRLISLESDISAIKKDTLSFQ